METINQYFGDLESKLDIAKGYIDAVNSFSRMQTEQDGILRPTINVEDANKAIIKQHRKFYGETSKYDGKGNLREAL